MTIAEALDAVVVVEEDLFTLLQAIYVRRFSGVILLHCQNGLPKRAEFPGTQVTLAPAREGIDSPAVVPHADTTSRPARR